MEQKNVLLIVLTLVVGVALGFIIRGTSTFSNSPDNGALALNNISSQNAALLQTQTGATVAGTSYTTITKTIIGLQPTPQQITQAAFDLSKLFGGGHATAAAAGPVTCTSNTICNWDTDNFGRQINIVEWQCSDGTIGSTKFYGTNCNDGPNDNAIVKITDLNGTVTQAFLTLSKLQQQATQITSQQPLTQQLQR